MTDNMVLPQGKDSRGKRIKTCVCSFRIEQGVKARLQALAGKQGRSLSSLIERILNNFLESSEKGNLPPDSVQRERRQHTRKDILIPGRWRVGNEDDFMEYDVLVKNISMGGAYTVYHNGFNFRILQELQAQPLRLFIKMPGARGPVELDCEARHFHITKDLTSVGIEFVNPLTKHVLFPQPRER